VLDGDEVDSDDSDHDDSDNDDRVVSDTLELVGEDVDHEDALIEVAVCSVLLLDDRLDDVETVWDVEADDTASGRLELLDLLSACVDDVDRNGKLLWLEVE